MPEENVYYRENGKYHLKKRHNVNNVMKEMSLTMMMILKKMMMFEIENEPGKHLMKKMSKIIQNKLYIDKDLFRDKGLLLLFFLLCLCV